MKNKRSSSSFDAIFSLFFEANDISFGLWKFPYAAAEAVVGSKNFSVCAPTEFAFESDVANLFSEYVGEEDFKRSEFNK